eukprot:m.68252 g.68252  ORF g.68252 m.68252 type:complete len:396 (-) comp23937_c0_seq1:149-1336(-)
MRLLDRRSAGSPKTLVLCTLVFGVLYLGAVFELSSLRKPVNSNVVEDLVELQLDDARESKEPIPATATNASHPDSHHTNDGQHLEPQTHVPKIMAQLEPGCEVHPTWTGYHPRTFTPELAPQFSNLGSVAFIGIARNIGRIKIEHARQSFESFGNSVFKGNYFAFFLENDSDDCTGTVLKEWERDDPDRVTVLSEKLNSVAPRTSNHMQRIKMISLFRNRVLRMMKSHKSWPFDYVVVVDLDMQPFEPEVLATAFEQEKTWDMVCANGVMSEHDRRYYDAFAFRSDEFPLGLTKVRNYFGLEGYVSKIHKGLVRSVDDDMVPVHSCFGGLAIYRGSLFESCTYTSPDGDCEHYHLHRCMAESHPSTKNFFMLPAMRLVYDLDENEIQGYNVKTTA